MTPAVATLREEILDDPLRFIARVVALAHTPGPRMIACRYFGPWAPGCPVKARLELVLDDRPGPLSLRSISPQGESVRHTTPRAPEDLGIWLRAFFKGEQENAEFSHRAPQARGVSAPPAPVTNKATNQRQLSLF